MKEFLEFLTSYLNLSYTEEDFKVIKPSTAPRKLVTALNNVSRLQDTQKVSETLMKIAKNPFDEIEKFYAALLAFNNLLNEKERLFSSFVDTASKETIEIYKQEISQSLDEITQKIDNIGGVENANN